MSVVARVEEQAVHPEQELAALIKQASGDGAVVSFPGITRPRSKGGEAVYRLVLEHHPALTLQSLEEIAAVARFRLSHARVVHRCGDIAAGEPVVFAAAAALHRGAAIKAADFLMDRLKTEAVFWKREVGETGSAWIEPTDANYAERERWH